MTTMTFRIDGTEYTITIPEGEDKDDVVRGWLDEHYPEYSFPGDDGLEDGDDLATVDAVSAENQQHLTCYLVDVTMHSHYEAERELTRTTRYHRWYGTVADRIASEILATNEHNEICSEGEEVGSIIDAEKIEEYNRHVVAYNGFGAELPELSATTIIDRDMTIGI